MRKILIIDDEKDAIDYLEAFLSDNGYETISANNADNGLGLAAEQAPDLITLDITMPGKSGINVYRNLRESEKLKDIPVIVITGVTGFGNNPDDFKKFLESRKQVPPPDGFMPKPIDPDKLLKMIGNLVK